ncbi:MAG: FkbM family methyltransferase [Rhodospirillales bacterium]|nr:FkbM family methyltransferase [Rhodospirillales bacterium]
MSRASTSLRIQRILFKLLSRTRFLHPIVRGLWPAVELEVGGHRLLLHPADNSTERFMWLRGARREAASIGRLTLLVAGKRALILDVGANCGAYTLPLAEAAGAGSHIVAFEPNPVMAARLRRNLALNNLQNLVEIQEVSLGARDGHADLWINERNLGFSSLHAPQSFLTRANRVPVRRLVDFLPPPGSAFDVFVIKIDIEGFEDQALGPFLEAVADDDLPDAILAETTSSHLWSLDLYGLMKRKRYTPHFRGEDGNTLFLRN